MDVGSKSANGTASTTCAVRLNEAARGVYQAVEKALGHATVAVTKTSLRSLGLDGERVKDGKALGK